MTGNGRDFLARLQAFFRLHRRKRRCSDTRSRIDPIIPNIVVLPRAFPNQPNHQVIVLEVGLYALSHSHTFTIDPVRRPYHAKFNLLHVNLVVSMTFRLRDSNSAWIFVNAVFVEI